MTSRRIPRVGVALDDEWPETERRWNDHEKTGDPISVDEAMDRI